MEPDPRPAAVLSLPQKLPGLAELRQKFGSEVEVLEATVDSGEVIRVAVRKPSRTVYSKYRQFLFDEARRHQASDVLVADCIVYPEDKIEREAIFDSHPALVDVFAAQIIKLAGGGAETKKL